MGLAYTPPQTLDGTGSAASGLEKADLVVTGWLQQGEVVCVDPRVACGWLTGLQWALASWPLFRLVE
jgi:hypothetical protein